MVLGVCSLENLEWENVFVALSNGSGYEVL